MRFTIAVLCALVVDSSPSLRSKWFNPQGQATSGGSHRAIVAGPKRTIGDLVMLTTNLGIPLAPVRNGLTVISYFRPTGCEHMPHTKIGSKLNVEYTGWLCQGSANNCQQGRQFDTTKGRGPFELILGTTPVILGWEAGMQGMCPGEKRRLVIPSEQGYGAQGTSGIPGGADLVSFFGQMYILA